MRNAGRRGQGRRTRPEHRRVRGTQQRRQQKTNNWLMDLPQGRELTMNLLTDDGFRRRQYLLEEIMLQYSYPRLDINVSKGVNHLLKSPFCIHPKTGKICVPFNPRSADKFNPENVPTITQLIREINDYDTDRKKYLTEEELSKSRVKDYRKTSLNKSVLVFEEFVRKLEESCKESNLNSSKMNISLEF